MAQVERLENGRFQIDMTEFQANWIIENSAHDAGLTRFDYVPYPDGKVPNNAIIYPQNFEQETVEVEYPGEPEEGVEYAEGEGPEPVKEVVNVAENYAESMNMAWMFAYAAYEDLLQSAVPADIAERVLPSAMKHVRYTATIPETYLGNFITYMKNDTQDVVDYEELVTAFEAVKTDSAE